ncbi:3-methylmercaptopropionyl-CoA dehydrogenase [Thalassocella blandensis]|nr:3-methylmercaptopropionyl-CoA dehydrogenase [Thalassocella blandensis]
MAEYKAPLDDIRFVLNNVFNVGQFWQSLAGIEEVDTDTADAILEEAAKICEQVLAPLNREGDEEGSHWNDGVVTAPKGFKEAYQTYCEGGWGGLGGNPEYGGMGMPKTLVSAVEEMVQGSCISFGLAPMLTAGACLAMNAHAADELKDAYLEKMYSGQWAGAMDLTEPHCGTDLGLIRTKATPNGDGSYALTGTKIFITWGEHDMAENIIHFVLAKLPDAPPGSKGISLFLVPKFLPDAEGNVGDRNPMSCGSIEKKMGIKASATCVMNFDGAKGWLVGEANKGLACMFTMMNYERLAVGIQGMGVAENAYQGALAYAKERIQGRSPTGAKTPEKEADNLLVHPDVRRMLLTMKALNEGGRAFYTYVASWLDIAKFSDVEKEKAHAENMVALLTPISKAFLTDAALQTAVLGQQVLGGHGFIREWGQEQHVRDIRITQIYEGTNGVQAMDLIGRKTVMAKGELLKLFVDDVDAFLSEKASGLNSELVLTPLKTALADLQESTDVVLQQSADDACAPGAAAVDYLDMFGYVAYAYMWAKILSALPDAEVSDSFKAGKEATGLFFFAKLLPQVKVLKARIAAGSATVMAMTEDQF